MPSSSRRRRDRFPRVFSGGRRRLVVLLIANGAAQSVAAYGVAQLLRRGLGDARTGALDPGVVAALSIAAVLVLYLRVREAADAERLGQDYVTRVRVALFSRIADRPLHTTEGRFGLTMTRLISDLGALRNWVSVGLARGVVAAITSSGLLLALASIDWRYGLAAGAMVAGGLAVAAMSTPLLRARIREARRRRGQLANNLGEKVLASRTVRMLGRTDRERTRVRTQSRRLRDALVDRVRAGQALRSLPSAALPLALAALLGIAASEGGEPEDVTVAVLLIGLLVASLGELARAWDYRLAFDEGRRRIGDILRSPRLREAREPLDLPGDGPVELAFDAVRLTAGGPVRSLVAEPGDVVLVTGPSGCGKSTLLVLAARLRDPEEGEVRVDGVPLRQLQSAALHRTVQLVSPQVPLLRGRVGDNLGYGVVGDDEPWIRELVDCCGLGRSPSLPGGLDAAVAEQGSNLPPGVRARIALARAAAVRPRLLLVDDPAFAVDREAATSLRRVVERLGATTVVVGPLAPGAMPASRIWPLGGGADDSREAAGAAP